MRIRMEVKQGDTYGNFTVIKEIPSKNKFRYVLCTCNLCGSECEKRLNQITHGAIKSCGCLQREKASQHFKKMHDIWECNPHTSHNMTRTKLYNTWNNMKARCYRKNAPYYHRYGGRGITVCDEWKNNSQAFIDWATANGYAENLTIERKDVNGNYCPENCCWITNAEQQSNRRNNLFIEYNDEIKTARQWSKQYGLSEKTIAKRFYSGILPPELFSTNHSPCIKKQYLGRIIRKIDSSGNVVGEYTLQKEAAQSVNGTRASISMVLIGKMKSYKGFTWEYSEKQNA